MSQSAGTLRGMEVVRLTPERDVVRGTPRGRGRSSVVPRADGRSARPSSTACSHPAPHARSAPGTGRDPRHPTGTGCASSAISTG